MKNKRKLVGTFELGLEDGGRLIGHVLVRISSARAAQGIANRMNRYYAVWVHVDDTPQIPPFIRLGYGWKSYSLDVERAQDLARLLSAANDTIKNLEVNA